MAETFFQATNMLALLAWIALVLFPGKKLVSGVLCAVVVPGILALAYAGVIGWKLATNGPPPGDIMTLAGLRGVFSDDWVFAAAWTHYLVFDMVVGAWLARDSVRLGTGAAKAGTSPGLPFENRHTARPWYLSWWLGGGEQGDAWLRRLRLPLPRRHAASGQPTANPRQASGIPVTRRTTSTRPGLARPEPGSYASRRVYTGAVQPARR